MNTILYIELQQLFTLSFDSMTSKNYHVPLVINKMLNETRKYWFLTIQAWRKYLIVVGLPTMSRKQAINAPKLLETAIGTLANEVKIKV